MLNYHIHHGRPVLYIFCVVLKHSKLKDSSLSQVSVNTKELYPSLTSTPSNFERKKSWSSLWQCDWLGKLCEPKNFLTPTSCGENWTVVSSIYYFLFSINFYEHNNNMLFRVKHLTKICSISQFAAMSGLFYILILHLYNNV